MSLDSKILIVGSGGIVETALTAHYQSQDKKRVFSSTRMGLDATIQNPVYEFFQNERPHEVILTSVVSGGIAANQKFSADFIYKNLQAQNNIIYAAQKFGVQKLLFVAASCMYPKEADQPIAESQLGKGPLEPSSEAYALAKWAGVRMCQAYRRQYQFNAFSIVPATIYGPPQKVDTENSHVMDALLAKFMAAVNNQEPSITLWGSGKPRREFIHIDDFIQAVEVVMKLDAPPDLMNAGVGYDILIKELTELIGQRFGFNGEIIYDTKRPDGTMQKLLDSAQIFKLGFKPQVSLENGIAGIYEKFKESDLI